jgi:hypothetical protein
MGRVGSLPGVKKAPKYLFSSSEADPEHTIGIGNYGAKTKRSISDFEIYFFDFRRQLGGDIPRSIDVHNPILNTKVTIDIPESKGSTILYRIFARENLIQLCLESLRKMPIISISLKKL